MSFVLNYVVEECPDHLCGRVWWESRGKCSGELLCVLFVLVRCGGLLLLELLQSVLNTQVVFRSSHSRKQWKTVVVASNGLSWCSCVLHHVLCVFWLRVGRGLHIDEDDFVTVTQHRLELWLRKLPFSPPSNREDGGRVRSRTIGFGLPSTCGDVSAR